MWVKTVVSLDLGLMSIRSERGEGSDMLIVYMDGSRIDEQAIQAQVYFWRNQRSQDPIVQLSSV